MIRISVQLTRGAARYRVAVQAESIERALEIVERQNPGCEAEVAFPIDPEAFFVSDTAATTTTGPVHKTHLETNCVADKIKV